jgi:hypothetical protein
VRHHQRERFNVAEDLPVQDRSAAFLQLKKPPAAPIPKNEMWY